MLAEANGLRNAVFGEGEVLRGEAVDEVAVLVLDNDGLDDELRLDGEGVGVEERLAGLFCPICCARAVRQRQR